MGGGTGRFGWAQLRWEPAECGKWGCGGHAQCEGHNCPCPAVQALKGKENHHPRSAKNKHEVTWRSGIKEAAPRTDPNTNAALDVSHLAFSGGFFLSICTLFVLFGNYSLYFQADKFTLSLLPPTVPLRMGVSSFITAFQELGVYFRFHIQDISAVDGGKGIF